MGPLLGWKGGDDRGQAKSWAAVLILCVTRPPQAVKAVRFAEFGGPEVLEYVEVPMPVPEADEVLIDVAAAGVQLLDARQREGSYQRPEARLGDVGLPQITGSQVVGVVSEVVTSADASLLGQRVMGLLAKGGGYAQCAVAHPAFLVPIPGSADAFEMATLPGQGTSGWPMRGLQRSCAQGIGFGTTYMMNRPALVREALQFVVDHAIDRSLRPQLALTQPLAKRPKRIANLRPGR